MIEVSRIANRTYAGAEWGVCRVCGKPAKRYRCGPCYKAANIARAKAWRLAGGKNPSTAKAPDPPMQPITVEPEHEALAPPPTRLMHPEEAEGNAMFYLHRKGRETEAYRHWEELIERIAEVGFGYCTYAGIRVPDLQVRMSLRLLAQERSIAAFRARMTQDALTGSVGYREMVQPV